MNPNNELLSGGGTLPAEIASMFGTVLLAGFLRRLVGQAHGGGGLVTVRRVLRSLPFAGLVAADILVAVVALAGLVGPADPPG